MFVLTVNTQMACSSHHSYSPNLTYTKTQLRNITVKKILYWLSRAQKTVIKWNWRMTKFYLWFSQWVIETTKNSDETGDWLHTWPASSFAVADETIHQKLNEADEEKLRTKLSRTWSMKRRMPSTKMGKLKIWIVMNCEASPRGCSKQRSTEKFNTTCTEGFKLDHDKIVMNHVKCLNPWKAQGLGDLLGASLSIY